MSENALAESLQRIALSSWVRDLWQLQIPGTVGGNAVSDALGQVSFLEGSWEHFPPPI